MEDEEVHVYLVMVDQLHPNLVLPVSKRTEDAVLAVCAIVGIVSAELCLVFFQTVELFYLIVTFIAVLPLRARKIVVLILNELDQPNSTFWATEHSSLATRILTLRLSLLEW